MRKLLCLLLLGISAGLSAQTVHAPDFSVASAVGPIKLSQLRGQVVYVDFWASWCVPCRKSFPWLNEMQARYGKAGLKIIAINLDEDSQQAQAFLQHYPADFTVGFDPKGISAQAYGLKGMPSSYLIDGSGKLLLSHVGFRDDDRVELELKIRQAMSR